MEEIRIKNFVGKVNCGIQIRRGNIQIYNR